jgi:hypothetical protein
MSKEIPYDLAMEILERIDSCTKEELLQLRQVLIDYSEAGGSTYNTVEKKLTLKLKSY